MTHRVKWSDRVAMVALLALGVGSIARTVLADGANAAQNAAVSRVITTHQGKTLEDNQRTPIAAISRNGMGPAHPYAERSFSSAAYRENASSELRRMHEAAFGAESTTNAPSTDAVNKAVLKDDKDVKRDGKPDIAVRKKNAKAQ